MNVTTSETTGRPSRGARRLTESAARPNPERLTPPVEQIVDMKFAAVCGTVLLSLLIMAAILAMGSARPVPLYGVVGSALFGTVFGTFLSGAAYLAITDSRRHTTDDDH